MFDLSFKLNGRTVPTHRIADELTRDVKQKAMNLVEQRVNSIRCPVHNQYARVTPSGGGGSYEVSGCCEQLIDRVRTGTRLTGCCALRFRQYRSRRVQPHRPIRGLDVPV